MKKALFSTLICLLLLCGCGSVPSTAPTTEPVPSPSPTPAPVELRLGDESEIAA